MEPARDGIAHEPCTVNEALLLCPRKHSWDPTFAASDRQRLRGCRLLA
jgi:hypothetical protein